MDTSKIKNFIIIVLAIMNTFLLFVAASDSAGEYEVRSSAAEELTQLYETNGITLPEGLDITSRGGAGCEMTRDMQAERRMIEAVLGECHVSDQGGNIYVYTGANGQAVFRGTGEFEMLLNHGVAAGTDHRGIAADILAEMGIEADGGGAREETVGEQYIVTIDCMFMDETVYNARVEFTFSGDSLMLVSGRRVFDSMTESSEAKPVDVGTALVRFLNELGSYGYVCTAVYDISPGYLMNVTVSGDCIMTPVWHIETDAGSYELNAETGRLETTLY